MNNFLKREIVIWKEMLAPRAIGIYLIGKNYISGKAFNSDFQLNPYLLYFIGIALLNRFSLIYNYIKRPNYLEVVNDDLIIHRGFFRVEKLRLDEIGYFHSAEHFFDSNGFIKKNGWKVSISFTSVNERGLKIFLKEIGIKFK